MLTDAQKDERAALEAEITRIKETCDDLPDEKRDPLILAAIAELIEWDMAHRHLF